MEYLIIVLCVAIAIIGILYLQLRTEQHTKRADALAEQLGTDSITPAQLQALPVKAKRKTARTTATKPAAKTARAGKGE